MEPVVTGARPRDEVTAHLHDAVGSAVRQLIVVHIGVVLPALHADPDVSGLLLALQCVRVPCFTQPVIKRHREERVRREHIRGVAPEFRLHIVNGGIRRIHCRNDIRLDRIGIVNRFRKNDLRCVRIPLTREVPVASDLLQFIDISAGGETVRFRFREDRVRISAHLDHLDAVNRLAPVPRHLRKHKVRGAGGVSVHDDFVMR